MMRTETFFMAMDHHFGKPAVELEGYGVRVVADPMPPLGVGYSFQGTRRQIEKAKRLLLVDYPGIDFHTEVDLHNGQFHVRSFRAVD